MISEELSQKNEILIVDDIPDNIRLLSKILTRHGYTVRKALSGKMALKSIAASPPDLILLDINMPEMDGYELCQQLKYDEHQQKIPIIFLSAVNKTVDKVKAFNLGCVDYITKPFQVEEVIIRIKNQLLIQQQQRQLLFQNRALKKEITKRKQAENSLLSAMQELERLSIIDSLTKVANRRRFDQFLKKEWYRMMREKLPLSLILCDIDYFKYYNDHYGHLAGDNCLIQVAQLLLICGAKRSTDLLARYGGEEFAVILPNTPEKGAIQIAQSMRITVEKAGIPHQASLIQPYVTISIGVSTCLPHINSSIEYLINQADKALYQSKEQGRNKVTLAH